MNNAGFILLYFILFIFGAFVPSFHVNSGEKQTAGIKTNEKSQNVFHTDRNRLLVNGFYIFKTLHCSQIKSLYIYLDGKSHFQLQVSN